MGAVFRQARIESGYSQSRLANAAGYDHSYVSRIERETRRPSPEALEDFAQVMGLTPAKKAALFDVYGYTSELHALCPSVECRQVIDLWNDGDEEFHNALRYFLKGWVRQRAA